MSTFNGERFIKEQLQSVLCQNNVSVHLIVRDDGSTDDTVKILESFEDSSPERIEIIKGENIGWRKSFMKLLEYVARHNRQSDYFAFSDQDDVWLPDKLSTAICHLKGMGDGTPALYCSNQYYFKDGINHGVIRKDTPRPSVKGCLVRNYATGCTIVMNRELTAILAQETPAMEIPHDHWAYMVANLCGKVFIDPESHILYRQHDSNQIGHKDSFSDIWKRRIKDFKQSNHQRERTAAELLRIHGESMSEEGREAVSLLANYRQSLKSRCSLLFDSGYSLDKTSNNLWFKLRILFGIV